MAKYHGGRSLSTRLTVAVFSRMENLCSLDQKCSDLEGCRYQAESRSEVNTATLCPIREGL